ncbi:MAG: hypothetical protein GWN35_04185 [Actinobacteria bacterium]|nr:hypothetical protein [Actinomycetota bacterium]
MLVSTRLPSASVVEIAPGMVESLLSDGVSPSSIAQPPAAMAQMAPIVPKCRRILDPVVIVFLLFPVHGAPRRRRPPVAAAPRRCALVAAPK